MSIAKGVTNQILTGGVPLDVTRPLRVEGHVANITGGGVWNDVWEGGALTIPDPSPAGQQMQIKSTSPDDTLLGTGARIARLVYINSSDEVLFEDIELNGTTAVLTASTDIAHIGDLYNISVGSVGISVGDIDLTDVAGPTVIYNRISSGGNKSLSTFRYVPIGSDVYVKSITISGDTKGVDVMLRSDSDDRGEIFPGTWLFQVPVTMSDAPSTIEFDPAIKIPGGAKVKISARGQAAGSTISAFVNTWFKD